MDVHDLWVWALHLVLQKRSSEKDPLNFHALAFLRNTQIGSCARNMGKTMETGKIPAGETGVNDTSENLKLQ